MQPLELGPHVMAQLGVEIGQRLVEQQQLGPAHQGAADRDPLLLPARGRRRLAIERVGDPQELGDLAHAALDLRPGDPRLAQRIGQVVVHRQVRIEGEGLEDHGDPPTLHGCGRHVAPGELDLAGLQRFEAGNRAQGRRLAGSTGAEQAIELTCAHVERQSIQRRDAPIALDQTGQRQLGHGASPDSVVIPALAAKLAATARRASPGLRRLTDGRSRCPVPSGTRA